MLTPDGDAGVPRVGAAASTVAVSGATASDRPSPNTTTAGQHVATYDASGSIRVISSRPAAATTSGPTVIGDARADPLRQRAARADSSSISTVIGSSAAPAAIGE